MAELSRFFDFDSLRGSRLDEPKQTNHHITTIYTLYNVTVDLGSTEKGNVPAIHPRVIA